MYDTQKDGGEIVCLNIPTFAMAKALCLHQFYVLAITTCGNFNCCSACAIRALSLACFLSRAFSTI